MSAFDYKDPVPLFTQLVMCVKDFHAFGYLHRDIKPDNFMLKDGKAKLIDLGMAKKYTDAEGNHIKYSDGK